MIMIPESISEEVDELPATFHERKLLSESLLKRALKGLLIEIIERKILQPPYGRPDQPNPLVKLSEFLESGGLIESRDDAINDVPLFSYDYGFDPLQYLADYLRVLHPQNIRNFKDEQISAANRLTSQANHARKALTNFNDLKRLAKRLRSRILWGPLISPYQSSVSSTSDVLCACRVAKCGNLIIEISKDSRFKTIDKVWNHPVENDVETQKVRLSDLEFGTSYYLRCHLDIHCLPHILGMEHVSSSNSSTKQEACSSGVGAAEHSFQYLEFTTFPPHEESRVIDISPQVEVIKLVALSINTQHVSMDSIKNDEHSPMNACVVTCLLGGLFAPLSDSSSSAKMMGGNDISDPSESYMKRTFDLHRRSASFGVSNSVLRNSALLIAWHDRSSNSDVRLSEEEAALKKYLHDMRKYNSKNCNGKSKSMQRLPGLATQILSAPPKHRIAVMSPELKSVLQALPVETNLREDKPAVYQLYSTSMLGPFVQLLVLDHRRGYLGKEQGAWLRETLSASTARFKIILSGTPFGATSSACHTETETPADVNKIEVATQVIGPKTLPSCCTSDSNYVPTVVSAEIHSTGAAPAAAVTMQIPPPILSLGMDDAGRPHLSLAGILAAHQLNCLAKMSGKYSGSHPSSQNSSTSPEVTTKNADLDGNNEIQARCHTNQEKNKQENVSCKGDECPTIYTESGILILSAGACVPHQDARSALFMGTVDQSAGVEELRSLSEREGYAFNSQKSDQHSKLNLRSHYEEEDNNDYNDVDSVIAPYLAVCDPQGAGRPFCVELCVGGGEGIGGAAEAPPLPPLPIPTLGVTMLYNAPIPIHSGKPDNVECPMSSSGMYTAVVTLSDDASSLHLQLLAIRATQKHDILYRCTMKAATSSHQ